MLNDTHTNNVQAAHPINDFAALRESHGGAGGLSFQASQGSTGGVRLRVSDDYGELASVEYELPAAQASGLAALLLVLNEAPGDAEALPELAALLQQVTTAKPAVVQ